jgi:hypothetical protein
MVAQTMCLILTKSADPLGGGSFRLLMELPLITTQTDTAGMQSFNVHPHLHGTAPEMHSKLIAGTGVGVAVL